jgi:hypothetical protein
MATVEEERIMAQSRRTEWRLRRGRARQQSRVRAQGWWRRGHGGSRGIMTSVHSDRLESGAVGKGPFSVDPQCATGHAIGRHTTTSSSSHIHLCVPASIDYVMPPPPPDSPPALSCLR